MGDEVQELTVVAKHCAKDPITQPYCTGHDDSKYRVNVSRRTRDHAEDLGGRRLLLQGFRQLAVPRLQLLEQPHVLDGDDRLMGEGLQELDLPRREGPDL